MQLLKYGLKDGELVHIDSVPKGLLCGCVCPSCGGALVAHKGEKNQYHFKHYNAADCNHGSESALHIMAKKVVAESKGVYVPNAPQDIYDWNPKGKCYKFEEAFIEKAVSNDIRCDVLLVSGNNSLNVEIKVTHEVDDKKQINLYNENLRTIEVDLSDLVNDFDEIKIRRIIESGEQTELLYSPKAREVYAKWILGDWYRVYHDRAGNPYIKNSPCSASDEVTYFQACPGVCRKHGSMECHECWGAEEWNGEYFLCRGRYFNLDFKNIDKIIEVERKNDKVVYAEIVANGDRRVYGAKQ